MLIYSNKTCYANSFVIISTSCKYILCTMYIIVKTHSSYAISATPYYTIHCCAALKFFNKSLNLQYTDLLK